MKSFENIELFQNSTAAPPAAGASGSPSVNDRINEGNSRAAIPDRQGGARADQANGARPGATALPGTAGQNQVGQYNSNADAARDLQIRIAQSDIELLQQRLREQMLLMGDAIKNNTNMLRSIEQMKASFSGMTQIISIFARSFGATEFADDALRLSQALAPQPVMPDLTALQNMRDTVTAGLAPEVRAGVERAFDDAVRIAGDGVAAAPGIGSNVVRGAGDVDPSAAIAGSSPGGSAPAAASPGRITRAEWDARIGASGINSTLGASLNGIFTRADTNGNGELDAGEKAAAQRALQTAPGLNATQRQALNQGLTLDLTN